MLSQRLLVAIPISSLLNPNLRLLLSATRSGSLLPLSGPQQVSLPCSTQEQLAAQELCTTCSRALTTHQGMFEFLLHASWTYALKLVLRLTQAEHTGVRDLLFKLAMLVLLLTDTQTQTPA